ncbi:unnamed protein product [Phytophthora fragariaefolia]|uniref:Unnamed protein product n=1 Tax=Phytophthora fragariaefolia TaxID=1490495 RepID=A0A9W6Y393_9STRA|nr:unnamed protein product [Phytophthora fragariaefolia]
MYPSSTVTARNLNQATAPAPGYIWLDSPVIGTLIHSDHKIGVALHHNCPGRDTNQDGECRGLTGWRVGAPCQVVASFLPQPTSRSFVLHRAELARRCSPPPADTAPTVSPTTAHPLASSATETAGPNSPPSSGQPDGQASTSLTPPNASRAGAESTSARSPTPATAESSTEPEDSAVGSTSPPLTSATS